jgi:hypothetical protein
LTLTKLPGYVQQIKVGQDHSCQLQWLNNPQYKRWASFCKFLCSFWDCQASFKTFHSVTIQAGPTWTRLPQFEPTTATAAITTTATIR